MKGCWGTLNCGGGGGGGVGVCVCLNGDLVSAVADDLLEINEEPEKEGHVQMVEFGDENGRSQEEGGI